MKRGQSHLSRLIGLVLKDTAEFSVCFEEVDDDVNSWAVLVSLKEVLEGHQTSSTSADDCNLERHSGGCCVKWELYDKVVLDGKSSLVRLIVIEY